MASQNIAGYAFAVYQSEQVYADLWEAYLLYLKDSFIKMMRHGLLDKFDIFTISVIHNFLIESLFSNDKR